MNELKTLIDLCPGIRLPQYEEEIFSDEKLTEYYIRKLCDQYLWCFHDSTVPRMAYLYVCDVMKCRWPEAEAVIATDDMYRRWYNNNFGTSIQ